MASFSRQLFEIGRCRQDILRMARGLDSDSLHARRGGETWSILDVVEHLVLSEASVLQGFPDEFPDEPPGQTVKNRVLFFVVMFILRFRIPVKASSGGMVPRRKNDLEELAEQWDANHRWIRGFFEGLNKAGMRKAVFSHRVSGPLTPGQALAVLRVHMERHLGQIQRLVSPELPRYGLRREDLPTKR